MAAAPALAPVVPQPSYTYKHEPIEVLERVTPTLWRIRTQNDDEFCVRADCLKEVKLRQPRAPKASKTQAQGPVAWTPEYELFFEKLKEYGCHITVSASVECETFIRNLIPAEAGEPYVYECRGIQSGTSYQVGFHEELKKFVPPGGPAVFLWKANWAAAAYGISCKKIVLELLQRGFRLGGNPGMITGEIFPEKEQSSMVGLPRIPPRDTNLPPHETNLTQSDVDLRQET